MCIDREKELRKKKKYENKNDERESKTFVLRCQMPSNRQNVLIKSRGKMRTLIGISLLNKSTCHSGRFACILLNSISAASTLLDILFTASLFLRHSIGMPSPTISLRVLRSVCSTRSFTTLLFALSRCSMACTHYTDSLSASLSLSPSCDEDKRIPFIFLHVDPRSVIVVHFFGIHNIERNNLCVPSCGA